MRKRVYIALAVLLVMLAGVAIRVVCHLMPEPMHKGKSVRYWVDRACVGLDANESQEFRREVKDIGPAAVPRLIHQLRATNLWRKPYFWFRAHLPFGWEKRFPDVHSAEELHYGAARTLAMFGPDARMAVADLVRLLPERQYPVFEALQSIGPYAKAAVPALYSMRTNQDTGLRPEIAWALWDIGKETNMVLEICTNVMVPGVDEMNAGVVLSKLGTAAAPAVPFALNVLLDTRHQMGTRANAASVLGAARVSSPEIRAALLNGTQAGQEDDFRASCAMALWRLDSEYAALATRLALESIVTWKQQFSGHQNDFEKWLEIGDLDAQQAIPTLKQLLQSDSPEMRKEAAETLERIEAKTDTGKRPSL
ncbi:MAG: HEAT repeat domain-containing protein [Limisphaerales bacterium]